MISTCGFLLKHGLTRIIRCPNANDGSKSDRGRWYLERWAALYLKDAQRRLVTQLGGFDLTIEDVFTMQQMCAYEVRFVASLYVACIINETSFYTRRSRWDTPSSASCSQKTSGRDSTMGKPIRTFVKSFPDPHTTRLDLIFWYNSAFGSPTARVQGIGYIQELVSRLTHTRIATHNSSTNGTLNDNPITFPLGQSLYVDATHEVVVLNSTF